MRWFLDLSTRGKLFTGFGLMVILLVIVAAIAYNGITAIQASQKSLYEQELVDALDIKDVRSNQNAQRANVATMMLLTGRADQEALHNDTKSRSKEVDETVRRLLERNKDNPKHYAMLEEFSAIRKAYREIRDDQVVPLIYAEKIDDAKKLIVGVQAERNAKMRAIADQLVDEIEKTARAALIQSEQTAREAVRIFATMGIIAVILGVAMTMFLTRILADPLREISGAAERIATGDLTVSLPASNRADETGILIQTFRRMVGNLRDVTREIGEGVNVLASSAAEITASTTQVAAGSAETATAVSQTTTTVEEVKQTAQVS
ncbi:MAG: methyl-accepting chemotaxis protein, partial [Betaproteobacteria bacterium]|nr:methyl-accepting chemotaxis protein [Betaproteobacteria bacterium]